MRRQRGWVAIDSATGSGTTVSLYFPTSTLVQPATLVRSARPDAAQRRTRRLLLVDDDESVRRSTARAIQQLGHHVDVAANGVEALGRVQETLYDVVVSDVMMPHMGGLDLVRELRTRGIQTPVLLVTGYSMEDVSSVCRRFAYVDALGKPWSPNQLSDAIEQLYAASQGSRAPHETTTNGAP